MAITNSYSPTSASFGHVTQKQQHLSDGSLVVKEVLNWATCRDSFFTTDDSYYLKGFCVSNRAEHSYNMAAFVTKIENMLGIQQSKFQLTNNTELTWVYPSAWWFTSKMRKSFYTLAFRGGYSYDYKKDNFEEALFSFQYTQETKRAVRKFLQGYTIYDYIPNDSADHWFLQFAVRTNPWGHHFTEHFENLNRLKPDETLIAKTAHKLWEDSGYIHGNHQRHWEEAKKLLEAA